MPNPQMIKVTSTPFSTALVRERARLQMDRAFVAKHVGCSAREVRRWERVEAIPSVHQFKKLIGIIRRLSAHTPDWAMTATMDGGLDAVRAELAEASRRADELGLDPKPPSQSFAAGLRRVREDNEITLDELGELLGVSGAAVGAWENELYSPVTINLELLFEVMPELKAGVETGAIRRPSTRDISVPVGNRANVLSAVSMATKSSDDEIARPLVARVVHDDDIEEVHIELPARRSTVTELAEAYGRARIKEVQARQRAYDAQVAVMQAEADEAEATRDTATALALLDIAVAEEASQ